MLVQLGALRMDPVSLWRRDFAEGDVEVVSPSPTRRHTVGAEFVGFATLNRAFISPKKSAPGPHGVTYTA